MFGCCHVVQQAGILHLIGTVHEVYYQLTVTKHSEFLDTVAVRVGQKENHGSHLGLVVAALADVH